MKKKRVLVAISGGLDSSMAAKLLRDQGCEVLGVFLRLGLEKFQDEERARMICQRLGIKFYPINLSSKFKKEVIDYFLDSYSQGLTPNPCIKCNQVIKFDELIKLAGILGFDKVATGHYVKIIEKNGAFHLFRGRDESKDQSYFLYRLNQEKLKKIIFPLGDYYKKDLRKMALEEGIPFMDSESQDICFVPGDHNLFLEERLNLKPGLIKDWNSKEVLGEHRGLAFYTIGQRKGVDIGAIGPLYVIKTDHSNNVLYVTDKKDDPALFNKKIRVKEFNWVTGEPRLPMLCTAITRYGQKLQECEIKKNEDGLEVAFSEPQRALAPGQSVVFYFNNEVLGGGVMQKN